MDTIIVASSFGTLGAMIRFPFGWAEDTPEALLPIMRSLPSGKYIAVSDPINFEDIAGADVFGEAVMNFLGFWLIGAK